MTGWAMALVVLLVVLMLMVRGRTRTALAGIIPSTLIAASPVIGEVNRGRWWNPEFKPVAGTLRRAPGREVVVVDSPALWPLRYPCLLYTSDAADDLLCVDLGGRRIIKK